ncbi:hypothetical protein V1511DRAFT_494247 [Dipodascopsis uninucleata]
MATLVSPLVRVERGNLQPKILSLYTQLFKVGGQVPENDGFWVEFFLLKANTSVLSATLSSFSADDLTTLQDNIRTLFSRAVYALCDPNYIVVSNALTTLHVLLRDILAKQLTTSDYISILVGLEQVDQLFTKLVVSLENIMKYGPSTEIRVCALTTTLSTVCSAYKTSLINYFIQHDFFPTLIMFIDNDDTTAWTIDAFILLGLLSSYDRLEAYNPYFTRLADFVDESIMENIVHAIGDSCRDIRDKYISISDDSTGQFSLESVFSYSGLARRAKSALLQQDTQAVMNKEFAAMPSSDAVVLLACCNFVHANKFFLRVLVETKSKFSGQEHPFISFISLSSYLLQHQHRSERQAQYARLTLLIYRMLVEDSNIMPILVNFELKSTIRICRQRSPVLPLVKNERLPIEGVLDALIVAVNHNMKKSLDIAMYSSAMGTIHRTMSQLKRKKIRLTYHWSELWRSILSFIRFLTISAKHLRQMEGVTALVDDTVRVLVLAFSSGESFLSCAADYDDLFYKLIESGDLMRKFSNVYSMSTNNSSIGTLISIEGHYNNLIKERSVFSSGQLSSDQVSELIKSGYETLSISAQQGIDYWDRYRDSDERVYLKRVTLQAVADTKSLLSESMTGILSTRSSNNSFEQNNESNSGIKYWFPGSPKIDSIFKP